MRRTAQNVFPIQTVIQQQKPPPPTTQQPNPERNNQLLILGIFVTLVLTWGSSFILMKRGLAALSPLQIGALRMTVGGLVLAPFAVQFLVRNRLQYPWLKLCLASVTGNLLPAILFPLAQTRLDSSLVGALNSVTPLFTMLVGVFIFKTKFAWGQALGLTLGLLGTLVLIFSRAGSGMAAGAVGFGFIVVGITLLYAFNVNFVKTKLAHLKTVELTSLVLAVAAVPSSLYLLFGSDFVDRVTQTPEGLRSALYVCLLGAMGTALALLLFYKLIKLSSAVFAASNTYFLPFVALMWGVLDGEQVTGLQLAGLATILGGVYLASRAVSRTAKND